MAGRPGTARFGRYLQDHESKPNASGENKVDSQNDGDRFVEQHFLYNPSQKSRDVGSPPAKYYDQGSQEYCAPANHDGFDGGDGHISNLDERKVLDLTIYSTAIECADENGYRAVNGTPEETA